VSSQYHQFLALFDEFVISTIIFHFSIFSHVVELALLDLGALASASWRYPCHSLLVWWIEQGFELVLKLIRT